MSNPLDRPLALEAYEALADGYDERVETKPFNAYLERPSTRSLLPEIDGRDVLDVGCGPGVTTAELADQGGNVVGLDVSPQMLAHAHRRVGTGANFVRADIGHGLPFRDGRFDLVHSSLTLDYVADWGGVFAEVVRVLRPGGALVCSVGHPLADLRDFEPDDYFETERVSMTWTSFGEAVEVPTYRRPLEAVLNPLLEAGLRLDRVVEAKPSEAFREARPETYERVATQPTFLCLRASLDHD